MRPDLIDILACPGCIPNTAGELALSEAVESHGRIQSGVLTCRDCQRQYPVRNFVPRFLDDRGLDQGSLAENQAGIAANFGEAWKLYAEDRTRRKQVIHPYTEAQFLDWIDPLSPDDFKNRLVLDLGSGLGGFTAFSAGFGATLSVGLEISGAVDAAVPLLLEYKNLSFVQGDIFHPPFKPGCFDLVYSIGVLHHLPEPQAGFHEAAKLPGPGGGQLFIWVYGRENNSFVVWVIDPLRKFFSRLPVSIVRHLVAFPLSVMLYMLLVSLYQPGLQKLLGWLPYCDYFQWLRRYGFHYTWGMVTDQLIPPETHYHSREELTGWFEAAGLVIESMTQRNKMSWRVLGRR